MTIHLGTQGWSYFANNHYMGHSPATLREFETRLHARGISM